MNDILKVRTLLLIALLMGTMLLLGCPKSHEERIEGYLSKELVLEYRRLPGNVRAATAHRALAEIAALERATWRPLIVAMEKDGAIHRPVYELGVGRARLLDCRLSREGSKRTGSCSSFSYPAPWKKGAADEQKIPLTLHLTGQSHAQSAEAIPLVLGVAGYSLEGIVLIKSSDALVQGGTLLVPHPVSGAPGAFRLPLSEFSLLTTEEILSIGELRFAEPFPLPPSLATLLGTDTRGLLAVHGNLGIDLRSPSQGYQAQGEISVLGKSLKGKADIHPGAYIAASLGSLNLPGPIEGMCIPIRDTAVELGLVSQILRITGTTEIDSAKSLLCEENPR